MSTKFSLLFSHIKNLRSRYLKILGAFQIYDYLCILSAPNKVGKKKAIQNVKIFSHYKYFISISKEACRCYFFIEIAKFFDTDKRTLSLKNLLDFAESNISELTKKDFLEFHKERKFLPELLVNYEQLKLKDISELRRDIKKKDEIISKFRGYRDQYLAHDDADKNKYEINTGEIRQILNLIKKFIKIFYLRLDFASNSYVNYIEEPKREMEGLIKCLQDCEDRRLEDIKNKYTL